MISLLSMFSVSSAAPASICLPDATPTPDWSNPALDHREQESRWRGATTLKTADNDHVARLRAVYSQDAGAVYVEVLVHGDPTVDPLDDAVLVGLSDGSGLLPEALIRFAPLQDCGAAGSCGGLGAEVDSSAITWALATPGPTSLTWTPLSDVNSSPNFDVEDAWVVVSEDGPTWTLSFVLLVPTGPGGDIASDLRMFTSAVPYWPGYTSGTHTELPLLCEAPSPTSDDCVIGFDATTELPFDFPTLALEDRWPLMLSGCKK